MCVHAKNIRLQITLLFLQATQSPAFLVKPIPANPGNVVGRFLLSLVFLYHHHRSDTRPHGFDKIPLEIFAFSPIFLSPLQFLMGFIGFFLATINPISRIGLLYLLRTQHFHAA
ncbi:hypothetical protein ES703_83072 [subsurface metagenome]